MGKTKKARDAERKLRQQQQEKYFPGFGGKKKVAQTVRKVS